MGKGEESNSTEANESTKFLKKSSAEASKMLEAALLQMDGIISGKLKILLTFFVIFS